MTEQSSVSVAMATFNGGNFVVSQLESLARQTVLPGELVVTDDGSSDQTVKLVEEFAADAPFPVRMLSNDVRLGFADNFLKAANVCRGELIAFCDQDDIWRERKLECCLREFHSADVMLVTHKLEQVDADLRLLGYIPAISKSFTVPKGAYSRALPWAGGASMLVRRDVIDEVLKRWPAEHVELSKKWKRSIMAHDQIVFFVANALGRIRFLAEPLTRYRFHGHNVTNPLSNISMKIGCTLKIGATDYDVQAKQYVIQSQFLEGMAAAKGIASVSVLLAERAKRIAYWGFAAEARSRIYSEPNKLRRLRLIAQANRKGLYSSRIGLGGRRSLGKDLAFTLLEPAISWLT